MKCCFVDDRADFFTIMAGKLGDEFELEPVSPDDREQLVACDVIIVGLPSMNHQSFDKCMARLHRILRLPEAAPVVVFHPAPERGAHLIALTAGAYDCFVESGSLEELRIVLRRAAQFHELSIELRRLRAAPVTDRDFGSIIGSDPQLLDTLNFAFKIASADTTVLINGETGTGKELLARAMHENSPRAQQPFVAVACSSLPETLIEAELFGHERGAFTGATAARRGRFEAAAGGTIFLDEIGELSPGLQVKLLRVLQERTFERLGSNQPRHMDARIICATNRDLKTLIHDGGFRPDLFYRLNTIEIHIPPLRQRRTDIALLACKFLEQFARHHNRSARRISPLAMTALEEYDWPGNVRELQNVIERAVVICETPDIRIEHLPCQFSGWAAEDSLGSFEHEVRSFKRRLIQRALTEYANNKLQTARSLKIARSSLHRLIDELHVSEPQPKQNVVN